MKLNITNDVTSADLEQLRKNLISYNVPHFEPVDEKPLGIFYDDDAGVQAAEDAARDYGAKRVFLNTFRFQAPDFYLKHGYREVFRLDEFPYTGTKYYFTKDLV